MSFLKNFFDNISENCCAREKSKTIKEELNDINKKITTLEEKVNSKKRRKKSKNKTS